MEVDGPENWLYIANEKEIRTIKIPARKTLQELVTVHKYDESKMIKTALPSPLKMHGFFETETSRNQYCTICLVEFADGQMTMQTSTHAKILSSKMIPSSSTDLSLMPWNSIMGLLWDALERSIYTTIAPLCARVRRFFKILKSPIVGSISNSLIPKTESTMPTR